MLDAIREAVVQVVRETLGRREVRRGQVILNDAVSKSSKVIDAESGLEDEVSWGIGYEQVPQLGSLVWYVASDDTETSLVLLQADELLQLSLILQLCNVKVDASGISVVAPLFTLNGGANGGLVVAAALVAKLNRLEQQLLSHQHICAAPGMPTLLDPVSNPVLILSTEAELTNPKVLH